MKLRLMTSLKAAGGLIRDLWLIVGIAMCLGVGLEVLYRTQGMARRALAGSNVEQTPFSKLSWWDSLITEHEETFSLQWEPYVYFRRMPYRGSLVNVDSAGHRVTSSQARSNEAPTIFLFGGSTMFGSFQRDEETIPSKLAQRLSTRGYPDVHITNYGESGYVFFQEIVELLTEIRDGRVPDIVIFYDGINDVASGVQNGRPGLPQNEFNRARDFELGRAAYHWRSDVMTELRALRSGGSIILGRSKLVDRILRLRGVGWSTTQSTDLANDLLEHYLTNIRLVEALSFEYGFEAVYLWQPSLHATGKPLDPWEQQLVAGFTTDPFQSTLQSIHRRIARTIDSLAVARLSGARFLNLSTTFDNVSVPLFVDDVGHTIGDANDFIIDAIMPVVEPMLQQAVEQSQVQRSR